MELWAAIQVVRPLVELIPRRFTALRRLELVLHDTRYLSHVYCDVFRKECLSGVHATTSVERPALLKHMSAVTDIDFFGL
jgi:hypothetical protein